MITLSLPAAGPRVSLTSTPSISQSLVQTAVASDRRCESSPDFGLSNRYLRPVSSSERESGSERKPPLRLGTSGRLAMEDSYEDREYQRVKALLEAGVGPDDERVVSLLLPPMN
jgi:hypothetical protein